MMTIGRDVCAALPAALDREWLITNGLGGYASSTLAGANSRRYHGLLVAALQSPLGRTVLLAKIDEELQWPDRTYYLGTNEFNNDTIHPSGFVHLEAVMFDGTIPTFRFATPEGILDKTVWMAHGQNTTYVRYFLHHHSAPVTLRLLPFVTYRDFHRETAGSPDWHFSVERLSNGCEIVAFPDAVPLRLLTTPAAEFLPTGVWYWRFFHRRDCERGTDFFDDLYYPGLFSKLLHPGDQLTVIATVEPVESIEFDGAAALASEKERQQTVLALGDIVWSATAPIDSGFADRGDSTTTELAVAVHEDEAGERAFCHQLLLAADQFLASRPTIDATAHPSSIIAGYHWFADWGRDAMIALPGLTLATGRPAVAAAILRSYAEYFRDGMLPNCFPDSGEAAEYNSVDAALWYFQALNRYLRQTDDDLLLAELFPRLAAVVDCYSRGTHFGIAVDPTDGLLRAGSPGVALTWMDAMVDNWVVTPRCGKPVEVNALWHSAVSLMAGWAGRLDKHGAKYQELADIARASFAARFWYEDGGYLYDVVDGEAGDDPSLRPNQVIAVALPHRLLSPAQERAVVDVAASRLWTPRGLRSLDPADQRYHDRYEGDRRCRDGAYHQGTVWAWLIGPFVDAHLKVYGDRTAARALLKPFRDHLAESGIGTIGEVFDGQWPHVPRGCIAQAWSVAEVLRAWWETRIGA